MTTNDRIKINDDNIPLPKAFVKLGKIEYMAKYVDDGAIRFAPAYEFSHMQEGRDGVADRYEGSLFYPISKLYVAPLLSDNENGVVYGKPVKTAPPQRRGQVIKRKAYPSPVGMPFVISRYIWKVCGYRARRAVRSSLSAGVG